LPVVCISAPLNPDTVPYFYGKVHDFQTSQFQNIIGMATLKRVRWAETLYAGENINYIPTTAR